MHKKDYLFISEKQFTDFVKKNQFLEHAQVFGFKYGTLKKTILTFFKKKKDVLFDIDWQGFQQLKQTNMEVVGIFILPPSKKELVNRLKTRGRDTRGEMKKRMNLVQNEISHFPEYDYVVINKDINIERASTEFSYLAQATVDYVLQIIKRETYNSHKINCEDFCIIAYGRFGTFTMTSNSDLDLVFVYGKKFERKFCTKWIQN